jgi:FMN phosphatase YigB (HAD superfamily)
VCVREGELTAGRTRKSGVSPSKALYVGDSLPNDIGMANDAGVWSASARLRCSPLSH